MKRVTTEIEAWLPSHESAEALNNTNPQTVINSLAFSTWDMTSSGWMRVGMATISVDIPDEKQIVVNQVESLRAEMQKTRADAEMKCRELDEKVQRLLAIEYAPA